MKVSACLIASPPCRIAVILEQMYVKISCEDQTLRTFRRSLSFGHYIKRTLIPLLMSTKREAIIELTVKLLANLTLPVECLYSVEIMSRTDAGRKNIAEICAMLAVTKRSFANSLAIRALVDYLRSILEKDTRISSANCLNINNCLIVLRNVLHIPDAIQHSKSATIATSGSSGNSMSSELRASSSNASSVSGGSSGSSGYDSAAPVQNQIIYNLFALNIDKLLIHLMSCVQRGHFAVAMVQVMALLFKDQHISSMQSMLSSWYDASMSDSSSDFESNTTPMKATSGNSSPMLTSDSSDNGGSNNNQLAAVTTTTTATQGGNGIAMPDAESDQTITAKDVIDDGDAGSTPIRRTQKTTKMKLVEDTANMIDYIDPGSRKSSVCSTTDNGRKKSVFSEISDCGYGTQVESSGRPEVLLTTSSNEDEQPQRFHLHQKPPATNQKQRYNAVNNPRSAITRNDRKEWRRKKLVKRSKTNL